MMTLILAPIPEAVSLPEKINVSVGICYSADNRANTFSFILNNKTHKEQFLSGLSLKGSSERKSSQWAELGAL